MFWKRWMVPRHQNDVPGPRSGDLGRRSGAAANRTRKYTYDGLDRLSNVLEDPGGLNFTTDYQYDAAGDLLLVSQGYCGNCEQRHFAYDTLQRLTSAANPESGTTAYAY